MQYLTAFDRFFVSFDQTKMSKKVESQDFWKSAVNAV